MHIKKQKKNKNCMTDFKKKTNVGAYWAWLRKILWRIWSLKITRHYVNLRQISKIYNPKVCCWCTRHTLAINRVVSKHSSDASYNKLMFATNVSITLSVSHSLTSSQVCFSNCVHQENLAVILYFIFMTRRFYKHARNK